MNIIVQQIIDGLLATTLPEAIAVIAGIASVYLEQKENILLYPIGLVNTILYVYLSFSAHLLGEASVNLFYTIISIYGWIAWSRRTKAQAPALQITFSTGREWGYQLLFFAGCYAVIFSALTAMKHYFTPGAIPWADAFAAAAAYTGMLLLARKKVESWYWWIATNVASIPLYLVKGYAFSSVQFLVFSAMSVVGLIAWQRKAKAILAKA
jgi:nicotinamide mononucleotide transporter